MNVRVPSRRSSDDECIEKRPIIIIRHVAGGRKREKPGQARVLL